MGPVTYAAPPTTYASAPVTYAAAPTTTCSSPGCRSSHWWLRRDDWWVCFHAKDLSCNCCSCSCLLWLVWTSKHLWQMMRVRANRLYASFYPLLSDQRLCVQLCI